VPSLLALLNAAMYDNVPIGTRIITKTNKIIMSGIIKDKLSP
jgi:hypothetical protein